MVDSGYLWQGVTSIVQTPFDETGQLQVPDLARQVRWLIDSGVDAVGFGFASEIRRMTDEERDRAVQVAVEAADGRVPVMAAVASGSTWATIERCRAAERAGAVGVLVPPPTGCPQDQAAILRYCESVGQATELSLIVQDAPIQSGVSMDVKTLVRIATELPNVGALKLEAPPTVPKLAAVRRSLSEEIPVLGGAGGQDLLHELAAGASGTMPGAAFPRTMQRIVGGFHTGGIEEAAYLFAQILPFIALARRNSDAFAYANKEVLRLMGVISSAHLRAPAMTIDDTLVADLNRVLRFIDEASSIAVTGTSSDPGR